MSLKDWALEGRGTQENWLIVKDPPPGLRTVYPNKQQVKRQKVCMDKQVAPCLTPYKKEAHRRWKQGLVTLQECGSITEVCRDVNKEAYVHLELKLVRGTKTKSFAKYVSGKQKASECVFLLLNRAGTLVIQNRERLRS